MDRMDKVQEILPQSSTIKVGYSIYVKQLDSGENCWYQPRFEMYSASVANFPFSIMLKSS